MKHSWIVVFLRIIVEADHTVFLVNTCKDFAIFYLNKQANQKKGKFFSTKTKAGLKVIQCSIMLERHQQTLFCHLKAALVQSQPSLPYEGRIFLLPAVPIAALYLPCLVTTVLKMSGIQEERKGGERCEVLPFLERPFRETSLLEKAGRLLQSQHQPRSSPTTVMRGQILLRDWL